MLAYPTESQKGMFIGIFWAIFNLGGVVGASVSLGQNFHSTVSISCLPGLPLSFLEVTPDSPSDLLWFLFYPPASPELVFSLTHSPEFFLE